MNKVDWWLNRWQCCLTPPVLGICCYVPSVSCCLSPGCPTSSLSPKTGVFKLPVVCNHARVSACPTVSANQPIRAAAAGGSDVTITTVVCRRVKCMHSGYGADFQGVVRFAVVTSKPVAEAIAVQEDGTVYMHRHFNTSLVSSGIRRGCCGAASMQGSV